MSTDNDKQKYAYLDQLSTEQLMELLRADIESPEYVNEGVVLHILEVIECRGKENPSGLVPDLDVDQAWEDFKNYYDTPDGEGASLYEPEKDFEPVASVTSPSIEIKSRHTRKHNLCRRAIIAAATVAIIFAAMIAAQAMGFDVFGALARWSNETFQFIPMQSGEQTQLQAKTQPQPNADGYYQSMQDALEAYGMSGALAPSWYPEGSTMVNDIEIDSNDACSIIGCSFTIDSDLYFNISIEYYKTANSSDTLIFEKDKRDVEEYASGNRLFYIFTNLENKVATWSDGQLVISVDGNIPLEDIKQIINSIGE